MKKNVLITLTIVLILQSCKQRVSDLEFKEDRFFDSYSIKVSSNLSKKAEGIWVSSDKDDGVVQLLQISVKSQKEISLDEHLNSLISADKTEINQNKSLIKKESIEVDGLHGLYAVYEKKHNKGLIPIVSYFTFAVLQDGSKVIGISESSLVKDCTDEILTSIKSIKKEPGISLEPKIDLNKMRKLGFQVFESENFIVKCNCKLVKNSVFLKMLKESGDNRLVSAYFCSYNEDNFDKGTITNINIEDLSKLCSALPNDSYNRYVTSFLNSYASQLKSNNTELKRLQFLDVEAIQYEFDQMGLPTKALFFVKNKKSYLIQLSSRSSLASQFNAITSSFKVI